MEIVRYDKAGKWYLEPTDPALKRQTVTVREAAMQARECCHRVGIVRFGLPGGATFDRIARGDA